MHTTEPVVLDHDPAALDVLWHALDPEPHESPVIIRAVMIASVDGTTTVDGHSGGLGTPTDRLVYDAMRARADIVLVGSGTALAEGYGPARISEVWASRRDSPAPPVLILSRSVSNRLIEHCAAAGDGVQIAAAPQTPSHQLDKARAAGVTVHVMQDGLFAKSLRVLLTGLGAREVTFEGGPTLLAEFLSQGLVDELVLSVAPDFIVGGTGLGLTHGEVNEIPEKRISVRVAAAFSCPLGGLYTRWVVRNGTPVNDPGHIGAVTPEAHDIRSEEVETN